MTPKRKPGTRITPSALDELKRVPGNQRMTLINAIDNLELRLRPHNSKKLELTDPTRELRRLRLGKWRIIYLITTEIQSSLEFASDHPTIIKI